MTEKSTETFEGSACNGKGGGSIVWKEKVEEIDQFNLFQQVHAFQLKPFVRAVINVFFFQHDKMTSSSSSMSSGSTFRKLTETELERQPEEVFDLVEEIGKERFPCVPFLLYYMYLSGFLPLENITQGSYGTVHRAILREDGELEVAIKKVILDSELHDIIKEIAIMQQCESPFVVRYYGSYFANQSLWIVMEYCGGGSISDLLRARKQPLDEGRLQNNVAQSI